MSRYDDEFDEFFAGRAPVMRRIAYTIVGDWQAAEDVVQSAFVKVYLAWSRIRKDSLEAYTRRAVVNTSITHVRRSRREVPAATLPELGVADPEPSQGIIGVLQGLPPRQRAVLALRFLDDLSVSDVALVLQITEGTVKSQTARGLATLRQHVPHPQEQSR